MSAREVVGGFKEVKITGKQQLHVGSIGAAPHPPVDWGMDQLALIRVQLILTKAEKLFWVLGFRPFCSLALSTGSSERESAIVLMIAGFLFRGAVEGERDTI